MAIHAHIIPAPVVQPLLRAAGPCRVLTDVDIIALTTKTVLTLHVLTAETLDMLAAIPSAPLPSLASAFARRRQIFGGFNV